MKRFDRWLVVAVASAISALAVALTPMLLIQMKSPLETRFPPATLTDDAKIAGIVVPGGSLERMKAALRLSRRFPQSRVILSGPHPSEEALFRAAAEADVTGRFQLDGKARNTVENARNSLALANPAANERWLLVTSALHMPRAMATFQAVGFNVEPWPVDDAHLISRYVFPVIARELLGLVYYRLRGYTAALWPVPTDRTAATPLPQAILTTGVIRP